MKRDDQLKVVSRILLSLGVGTCLLSAGLMINHYIGDSRQETHSETLTRIIDQGKVRCSVSDNLPGIGSGETGIEADLCRAIAIAIFGNASNVEFYYSIRSFAERMAQLNEGEIDVVFRSTLSNVSLPAKHGYFESTPYYYEPVVILSRQGIIGEPLVKVCSVSRTQAYNAIFHYIERHSLSWELITTSSDANFKSYQDTTAAFINRECDGVAGRLSVIQQWVSKQQDLQLVVEPLAAQAVTAHVAAVSDQDAQWLRIVNTAIWSLIDAELLGFSQNSEKEYRRDGVWSAINLNPEFASLLIRTMGNYRELYQRHFGNDHIGEAANHHYLLHEDGLFSVDH